MGLLQRQQNEGENQDFIALYHLCTGFELSKMGDTEGAVNHFQKAIDIYKCNSSKINILFGFTLELAASFLPRLNFRGQPRCTSQLWNFSSSKRPLIPTSLQYFATTLHACCLLKMTWRGRNMNFARPKPLKGLHTMRCPCGKTSDWAWSSLAS